MTFAVNGIDISKWQDPSTDAANMDGCEFVGIRACYGALPYTVRRPDNTVATVQPEDASYPAHEANARQHGAVVIAYCFGRNQDGAAQARKLVQTAPNADLYALDLESDGGATPMTNSQASAFFAAMRTLTPKKVGLYHSESGFPAGLGQSFNWVANWSHEPSIPWAFWQTSGSPLDKDVFNGTLDQLRAMAGVVPASRPHVRVIGSFQTYTVDDHGNVIGHTLRNVPVGTIYRLGPDRPVAYRGLALRRLTDGPYAGLWVNPHGSLRYSE